MLKDERQDKIAKIECPICKNFFDLLQSEVKWKKCNTATETVG